MKPIPKTLFIAAILAAGFASGQAPVPDDETPPPDFDREAGYRRRYTALPANTPPRNISNHQYDRKFSAKYVRTGQITTLGIEDEFPLVRPTMVTLSIKDATPKDAAAELSKAIGFKIRAQPIGYLSNDDHPKVNLELDKKPALEAFLEFASQTGTRPYFDERGLMLYEGDSDKAVGTWCVTGPFAVILTRIERTIPLAANDPNNYVGMPQMRMQLITEPKIKIVTFPHKLDVEIIQDELGNNLTASPTPEISAYGPQRMRVIDFSVPLKIPSGAGSRIKIFRASYKINVQTESVAVDLPVGDKDAEKSAGLFKVRVGAMSVVENQVSIGAKVTVSRGTADAGTWADLVKVLPGLQPRLCDDAGKPLQDWGTQQGRANGDEFTLDVRAYHDANSPLPTKVAFELPVSTKEITVPFVFRDLMLP